MASNGEGALPSEMARALGNCFEGNRHITYDNIMVDAETDGSLDADTWPVDQMIRAGLFQLAETMGAGKIRARQEWGKN